MVKLVEPRVTTVDGFHWADAAIGAGTLLGLILLAVGGGAIAVVRRRRRAAPRVTGLSSGAGSGVERRARGRRAGASAGPAYAGPHDGEVTRSRAR